jgi:hypothetical protein
MGETEEWSFRNNFFAYDGNKITSINSALLAIYILLIYIKKIVLLNKEK